ncbi:MAG TPA: glycosyltransferase [Rhizomicrobium sp.]|jgi:glycosyltransferase involved in cell wall biosynthesis
MKTAIIIPTHRRADLLERLLFDLDRATLAADTEIHVVENGPRSGAEEVCQKHPLGGRMRYCYLPEGRKSAALNHAIANSDADLLIFFDDDIRIPRNIVDIYEDAALRHGHGYFFGGPLATDAEIPCPSDLAPYLPLSAKGWSPSSEEATMDAATFEYFFGANWSAFRGDLTRAGLFAENLGITASHLSPLGEENEIQERLIQANVKPVYLPGALIQHHVPRECYTTGWVWRRRFRLGVTDWTRKESAEQQNCRKLFGVPAWLLRTVAQRKVMALLSMVTGRARQTDTAMRDAYLSGLLHGAWTTRGQAIGGSD